jgi:hypothetical protein
MDRETEVFQKLVQRGQIIQKSIEAEKAKTKRQNVRDSIYMVILFIIAVIAYIHVFWK